MNQNELKAWNNLNSVATMVFKLKPWEDFSENDLFAINLPGRDMPIYCVVMGMNVSQVGVAIYNTNWGVWGLELSMKGYDAPANQARRYNECLVMSIDVKENLSKDDMAILSALDVELKDGQSLPKFTSIESKFWPNTLTISEAEVLAEALFYLEKMLTQKKELNISIDSKTEMLKIDYNSETEKWEAKAVEKEFIYREFDDIELSDKSMINKLKSKDKTERVIEIDLALTKFSLNKEGYKKAFIGRQFMMANHGSDKLILNKTIEPNDDDVKIILLAFTEYVDHFGKPEKIMVRDAYTQSILRNLCAKLDIKIEVNPRLLTIDKLVYEMENYFDKHQ